MEQQQSGTTYDVIVIGGGPAGMMAAGRAAELGASVLLLEKNPGLGKKLLISGGGRSNVTNAEFDTQTLLKKYKDRSKFLHSPFAQFGVKETIAFFETHGMPIKVEEGKRAFPKSDTARSVLEALETYMKHGGVTIRTKSPVQAIAHAGDGFAVTLTGGMTYGARGVVVSSGGMSHPETGSTGEGFGWLAKFGHRVAACSTALVPIATAERWGHKLSGLAFAEAKVSLFVDGKAKDKKVGKILFTHVGLSGPLILNMSKQIGESFEEGVVTLAVDLFPKEDRGALDRRLQSLLNTNLNKKLRNVLKEFIPASLVPVALSQNNIDGEKAVNDLRREERTKLCAWLKEIVLTPTRLLGKEKAVVTSGGIDLAEVDMRTMESKKQSGLYVVGDVLDIDRPSGGYSLQLCWTTGWVAGAHAGKLRPKNVIQ